METKEFLKQQHAEQFFEFYHKFPKNLDISLCVEYFVKGAIYKKNTIKDKKFYYLISCTYLNIFT